MIVSADQPELAKTVYENLDSLAEQTDERATELLAAVLTDMLGLRMKHRPSGTHWGTDSERRWIVHSATRRWLRDHGYLDPPETATV